MPETNWQRDRRQRLERDRRQLRLLEAATNALPFITDQAVGHTLATAIQEHGMAQLKRSIEYEEADEAREAAEVAEKQRRLSGLDELPEAPAGYRCVTQTAHDEGRWTRFSQCELAAKRLIQFKNDPGEQAVCLIHAKQELARPGSLKRYEARGLVSEGGLFRERM